MQERIKKYSLVLCLFVFLFVIIGGGFHLNPGGALVAALSGTPLVIHAFNHWSSMTFQREHTRHTVVSDASSTAPRPGSEPTQESPNVTGAISREERAQIARQDSGYRERP